MTNGSRDDREGEESNTGAGAGIVPPDGWGGRRHCESLARAGGRAIDPLAVLHGLRAASRDSAETDGARFDATAFVTAYGRIRGRDIIVEYAALSRRGLLAETWICETYDVIRVDRQIPQRIHDIVILVEWAGIHFGAHTGDPDVTASFDALAAAVVHHNALPTQPTCG